MEFRILSRMILETGTATGKLGHMANTVEQAARLLGRNHDVRFDRLMPGYHDRLKNTASSDQTPIVSENFPLLVGKLCLVMAVAAGLIYGAAGYYGSLLAKAGYSASAQLHQVEMGNELINVPENMIRFKSQRRSGSLKRLDLFVHWPTMAGYSEQHANVFNSNDPAAPILYAAIEPRDMTRDMSGRIASIYESFFSGPPVEAGHGLVRRAFSANSAYFSEDLYYEAASPYPFAARCIRESDKTAGSFCIRDIHIGRDLMVTYRFHASLLRDWMALDHGIRDTFTRLLAD